MGNARDPSRTACANDPQRLEYMDQALTPLVNEVENLEL